MKEEIKNLRFLLERQGIESQKVMELIKELTTFNKKENILFNNGKFEDQWIVLVRQLMEETKVNQK